MYIIYSVNNQAITMFKYEHSSQQSWHWRMPPSISTRARFVQMWIINDPFDECHVLWVSMIILVSEWTEGWRFLTQPTKPTLPTLVIVVQINNFGAVNKWVRFSLLLRTFNWWDYMVFPPEVAPRNNKLKWHCYVGWFGCNSRGGMFSMHNLNV